MVTCVDGQRQALRFKFRAQAPLYWGYKEIKMETTIMGYIGVILGLYSGYNGVRMLCLQIFSS